MFIDEMPELSQASYESRELKLGAQLEMIQLLLWYS